MINTGVGRISLPVPVFCTLYSVLPVNSKRGRTLALFLLLIYGSLYQYINKSLVPS